MVKCVYLNIFISSKASSIAFASAENIVASSGHLWGHVTLEPIAERWQWICHYLIYDLSLLRLGFAQTIFGLQGERSNQLSHHRSKIVNENYTCFGLMNHLQLSTDIDVSGIWRDMLWIFKICIDFQNRWNYYTLAFTDMH